MLVDSDLGIVRITDYSDQDRDMIVAAMIAQGAKPRADIKALKFAALRWQIPVDDQVLITNQEAVWSTIGIDASAFYLANLHLTKETVELYWSVVLNRKVEIPRVLPPVFLYYHGGDQQLGRAYVDTNHIDEFDRKTFLGEDMYSMWGGSGNFGDEHSNNYRKRSFTGTFENIFELWSKLL